MHYSFVSRLWVFSGVVGLLAIGPFITHAFATAIYESRAIAQLTLTGIRDAQGTALTTLPNGLTIGGEGDINPDFQETVVQGNATATINSSVRAVIGRQETAATTSGKVNYTGITIGDSLIAETSAQGSADGSVSLASADADVTFVFTNITTSSFEAEFLVNYSLFSLTQVSNSSTEFATASTSTLIDQAVGNNEDFEDEGIVVSSNDTYKQ